MASEIVALVAEKGFKYLKAAARRMTIADCPSPVSPSLEQVFYPTANTIVKAIMAGLNKEHTGTAKIDFVDNFKGPY